MDRKPTNISYVEVLSDSGNVPNVDLDPSFNTRAQLREDRYNKLLNQSSLDEVQTRLTDLHIQNSILENAARMSENLHRGALANGTEPQGNVLRSSWKENNTILGDMSTPSLSDMVSGASLAEPAIILQVREHSVNFGLSTRKLTKNRKFNLPSTK
jgi:hypothetical protein